MSRKVAVLLLPLCGLAGCSQDQGRDHGRAGSWFESPSSTGSGETGTTAEPAGPKTLFADQAKADRSPKLQKFVDQGTGRLIGQPASLPDGAVVLDDAGDITLNVVDADIREVVRLVLEDALGANYVIDPAVTGSITIRTSRPVPAKEILPLLSSVLEANGAALIEKRGLFHVLPRDQAASAGGRPSTRLGLKAGRPGTGLLVAPLRYASSTQLAELLQPFVANRGAVQADPDRNTLLITGSADQIATTSDLIEMFDVDWMAGMSFGFYPLERVQPADLVLELDQVFATSEDGGAPGDPVRFVPIDRLSALLVIAQDPALLQRAETWIGRLDKVGEGDEDQIYVYPVQNGRAADLASVLGELFDIRSTAIGADPLLAPGLEPVELRSSLLSPDADPEANLNEQGRQDATGRRRPERSGRRAQEGSAELRDLTQGQENAGTKIVADEANNSLLIKASPKDYRNIEAALRELDRPPLQVLLEATIAEVTLRDELTYGIQWFFNSGRTDFTLSERANGSVQPFFPGFSGILSSGDVRVVIDALESVSDVNVISSPQILVLDNQTAQLEVGDEVPIVTQQAVGLDTVDARTVNTVEQRQTGVILNVTPRVNASGLVVLDIQQEVSDVVRTTTSGIDSPTIAQRRVGTTVAVDSDQTVALGGLIQDDVDVVRAGIPILSNIPVIGWLFGSTTNRKERTELLILITPKVLPDSRSAVAATDELKKRLRAVAPLQTKITDPFREYEDVDAAIEPAPAKPPVAKPSATAGADPDYMIQLASLPTRAEAEAAWQTYRTRYPDLLAPFPHRIETSTIDGDGAHRLQIGPLSSFRRAATICDRLMAEGADCLVVETQG
ncbi:MAG: type II secretion system secretin GspD [Alphaproteobacteria bacterium]